MGGVGGGYVGDLGSEECGGIFVVVPRRAVGVDEWRVCDTCVDSEVVGLGFGVGRSLSGPSGSGIG